MNIIFLGPPGAGKGTHAQRICDKYNIPQISTGDILRKAIKEGTQIGLEAKAYMDSGQLVPDSVIIEIAKQRLLEKDCNNGYILDGFPRTIAQAVSLDEIANIDFAINIDVDDEVIVKRLSGRRVCPDCQSVYNINFLNDSNNCEKCNAELIQRKDDCEDTIRQRLQVYANQTSPLIEYYKKQGKLISVDGAKAVDNVTADIIKAFEAHE